MYVIVRVLEGSVSLVSSSIRADCDMTIGAAPDPQVRYRWAFTIPAGCKQAAKISSVSAHAEEDEVCMRGRQPVATTMPVPPTHVVVATGQACQSEFVWATTLA